LAEAGANQDRAGQTLAGKQRLTRRERLIQQQQNHRRKNMRGKRFHEEWRESTAWVYLVEHHYLVRIQTWQLEPSVVG
jgi:hypothetical protein